MRAKIFFFASFLFVAVSTGMEDDSYMYWLRALRPIRARLHSLARDMHFPSLVAAASSSTNSSSFVASAGAGPRKYRSASKTGGVGKKLSNPGQTCIISRHVTFIRSSVKECIRKFHLTPLNHRHDPRETLPLTHMCAYQLVSSWFSQSAQSSSKKSVEEALGPNVDEQVDCMQIYSMIQPHLRPLLFTQHLCQLIIRNCRHVGVIMDTIRLLLEELPPSPTSSDIILQLGFEFQIRELVRHLLTLWNSGLSGETLIWLYSEFKTRNRLALFKSIFTDSIVSGSGDVRFGEVFQFCLAVKCLQNVDLQFLPDVVIMCVWELMKRLGMNEQLKQFVSLLVVLLVSWSPDSASALTSEVWQIVSSIRLNECKSCLLLALFQITVSLNEPVVQTVSDDKSVDIVAELNDCFREQYLSFVYFSFGSLNNVLELCRMMVKCRTRFHDLLDIGYALTKYAVARYDYITTSSGSTTMHHQQPSFEKCLRLFEKFAIHVDPEYAVPEPGEETEVGIDVPVLDRDGMFGVAELPESGADEFFKNVFMPSSTRGSELFNCHDRPADSGSSASGSDESDVEEYVEYMRRKRRRAIMLSSSASPVPVHMLHETNQDDFDAVCMSPKSGADLDEATRLRILRKYQNVMSSPKSGFGNYF